MAQLYDLEPLDPRRRWLLQHVFETDTLHAIPLRSHTHISFSDMDVAEAVTLTEVGGE